jgi:tetratricopeptide (TPR) repeat protein
MPLVHRPSVHIIAIVIVVILIYSNTFTAPFAYDDVVNIVHNSAITDIHNFIDTSHFSKAEIFESLRPLLKTRYIGYFSFAVNYAVHGLDVKGYHVVNILIHICNSVLLYLLLQLTFLTPCFQNRNAASISADSRSFVALFTTLLFAVHPIQTQAVTYIVQRFASLAALFYLLSLVSYIRFRLDNNANFARKCTFYVLSLTSVIAAMKTKEFAILLPVVITLYEFTFFDGMLKKRILRLIPYIVTIAVIPFSLSVPASVVSAANFNISRSSYLLTQFRVVVTYLRLLIFPVDQNVDYDYPVYHDFFVPEVLLSVLFLLCLLATGIGLFLLSRNRDRENSHWYRLIACGLFWFFITIAPESSVIPIKDVIFEHRMYLPSIGLFLAATITIELLTLRLGGRIPMARKAVVSFMVILAALFSAATYARNNVWNDSVRLWEDIVRKSPNKPGPRYNLGISYADSGRINDAVASYKAAIRIDPDYTTDVYNNLGLAYIALGQVEEAIRVYKYASDIAKLDGDIHFNLANAYMSQGRTAEAASEYKAAIGLKPDKANFHFYLGVAYVKLGLDNEAINEYTKVIQLNPGDVVARNNLGNIYKNRGQVENALNEYRTALRINPEFAEAHYNIGRLYASLGRIDEAKSAFSAALRLKPDLVEARRQMEKLP